MNWFKRLFGGGGIPSFDERLESKITQTVREILTSALRDTESTLAKIRASFSLEAKIATLKEELETVRIEKGRKDEEFARKEREIEHKVGLERKRQEFEITQAKREATVEIKEKNLENERALFEKQMEYYEAQSEKRLQSLEGIIKPLLKALPTAEIIARLDKDISTKE